MRAIVYRLKLGVDLTENGPYVLAVPHHAPEQCRSWQRRLRACQRWEAYEYHFGCNRTVFNGGTTEGQRPLDELNLPFSSGPG
jgi:hypothetical protein